MNNPMPPDPLKPDTGLLIKLGSAIVHFEEASEDGSTLIDLQTARALANDPEVAEWREQMNAMALLPVKRNG